MVLLIAYSGTCVKHLQYKTHYRSIGYQANAGSDVAFIVISGKREQPNVALSHTVKPRLNGHLEYKV